MNYFDYLKDLKNASMYMRPIVEMDMIKIIEKSNQNKSAGNVDIGNYIIKRVVKEIVKPFTMIFNLSISTGVVPNKLKIAKVIPLCKKQDAEICFELSSSITSTLFFKDSGKTCI